MSSIIIDTNIMTLYDAPIDPSYSKLFKWLEKEGTLCISDFLSMEYMGTGNRNIVLLLARLSKNADKNRLIKIQKEVIKSFKDDKRFKYTSNRKDWNHARLTFLSPRKKMITQDVKLTNDINKFKKIQGIKPTAIDKPIETYYK